MPVVPYHSSVAMSTELATDPTNLMSNYSTSGFRCSTRSLPFGHQPALFVIDVCNAYFTPGSPLYAPNRFHNALSSTDDLISLCRDRKILIFTRVVYPSPESRGNWYKYKLPNARSPVSMPATSSGIIRPETRRADRNLARLSSRSNSVAPSLEHLWLVSSLP